MKCFLNIITIADFLFCEADVIYYHILKEEFDNCRFKDSYRKNLEFFQSAHHWDNKDLDYVYRSSILNPNNELSYMDRL